MRGIQRLQEDLGVLQIGRVEALSEPVVERLQECSGGDTLVLARLDQLTGKLQYDAMASTTK
jgi:hypothetical protein